MKIRFDSHRIRPIDNLEQMIPYLFALGCARTWMTLTFAAPEEVAVSASFDPHVLFDYAFAAFGVAATLFARRIVPLHRQPWAKPAALGSMLSASLLIVIAPLFHSVGAALPMLAVILGAFGFCTVLLMFHEAVVPLSLVRIALYSAASRFIAVPLAYLCQGLSGNRFSLVLMLLPLASMGSLVLAFRSLPAQSTETPVYPKFRFPWKPFAVVCVYAFAYGLRSSQLPEGAGVHSSLSTAIAMGGFFIVVYFFSDRFSVSSLFRSPLLLMICGLALIPAEGVLGTTAAGYLIAMGMSLISLLVGLLFYDLSKRMGISIVALTGITRATSLVKLWGSNAADAFGSWGIAATVQDVVITAAVVMLVLASTLMLLSEKELASRWGVRVLDVGGLVEKTPEQERAEARVAEVAEHARLTPRETEILQLIAQGKNGPAIMGELFIAEGTFKAHTSHIYEKCGVANRRELRALLGVG